MIGIFRSKIRLLVARNTIGCEQGEISLLLVLMTALAVNQGMPSHHWKLRICMDFLNIEDLPPFRRVALFAVASHFRLVYIFMTRKTIGACRAKIFNVVTRRAILFLVTIQKWKFSHIMIKTDLTPGC